MPIIKCPKCDASITASRTSSNKYSTHFRVVEFMRCHEIENRLADGKGDFPDGNCSVIDAAISYSFNAQRF